MKLEPTEIIQGPFITEKSTDLKDKQKTICFKVARCVITKKDRGFQKTAHAIAGTNSVAGCG